MDRLKNAVRSLLSDKRNTIIQLTGLILGIVSCIIILQYVLFEYSFDKFHTNSDLIYRTENTKSLLIGSLAKEEIPYITNYARMHPVYRGATISSGEQVYKEKNLFFADGSLFSIFSFPVVEGNVQKVLAAKNNMVISERYAKKYFGNVNPIGKTLVVSGSYEKKQLYKVGAVFKNIPDNSHLKFDILLSVENIFVHRMYSKNNQWKWGNFFTYIQTNSVVDNKKINADITKIAIDNGEQEVRTNPVNYNFISLTDLHLNGSTNYIDNNMSAQNIYIWAFIAFVIIAIAWLNYINISIANAFKSQTSTGLKKVLGATYKSLWADQLSKAIILNGAALIFSVGITYSITPLLQKLSGMVIQLPANYHTLFWSFILLLLLTGAIITSFITNHSASRHKAISLLSRKSGIRKNTVKSPWLYLLTTQFATSIILICFALFATKQVNGLMMADKGIDTKQVLAIQSAEISNELPINEARGVFEAEVLKIPGVKSSSSAMYIPGMYIPSNMRTRLLNASDDNDISTRMNFVGYNYLQLFKHRFLAGRNFSQTYSTDGKSVVINKKLASMYGFSNPKDAIGKNVFWPIFKKQKNIIGVVDDFNQQSAENEIDPMMFHLSENARGYCLVNIDSENGTKCFSKTEALWNKIHPDNPFEYVWIDKHYDKQFARWKQFSQMASLLSVIAIVIACVGLFGLTSLVLARRTKEIGIRKVNGATIAEILLMLNKDFIKWVVTAFVVACPIAYYAMNIWLENFAYKTELSWWIFAGSGVLTLAIALLTVSWQSWKAATRNPVEALRYE